MYLYKRSKKMKAREFFKLLIKLYKGEITIFELAIKINLDVIQIMKYLDEIDDLKDELK